MTVKYRATFVYPDHEVHYDYNTQERRARSNLGNCTFSTVRTTKKPKTHDWNWAQKQLRKGKKVRRLDWETQDLRLEASRWGEIRVVTGYSDNKFIYNTPDCTATDWALYEP